MCLKTYHRKGHLTQHLRFECATEPRFMCPFCPKKCARKSNLKVHIFGQHPDKMDSAECRTVFCDDKQLKSFLDKTIKTLS